jgi:hypothetical protein
MVDEDQEWLDSRSALEVAATPSIFIPSVSRAHDFECARSTQQRYE